MLSYRLNESWSTPTKILFAIASAGVPIRQIDIAKRAKISVQLAKQHLPNLIKNQLIFCTETDGTKLFTTHPLFSQDALEAIPFIEPFLRRANDFVLTTQDREKTFALALESFFEMHILSFNGTKE